MSIKSWSCPGCQRDFIVADESTRDTCPWCKATIEDKSGQLQVVTETEKSAEPSDKTASAEGQAAGSGAPSSGSGGTGTQSWWPFEYSS